MTFKNKLKNKRVAVWVGLSDKKCLEHIKGLDVSDAVISGILFRKKPVEGLDKFCQINPPHIFRGSAFLSHLYILIVTIPICLRFKPHVCIGISLMPHSLFAKLGQIVCRAKFVTWLIGTDIYLQLAKKWWGKLLRKPMSKASCTKTMGKGSNKKLQSMGWSYDDLIIGRNAYDLSEYKLMETEKEWDIIYTGRLDKEHKRIDLLLSAVAELQLSCPMVKCAIVGEGPDKKRLEEICRNLGINSNVYFLGYRQDIPELLNKSRIFVMTSAWEGLPSSIVEAFVLGVPVVASNVGDISDLLVNEKNGILVNPDKPLFYAKEIKRLLKNQELYSKMSFAAKQTGDSIVREINKEKSFVLSWENALGKISA